MAENGERAEVKGKVAGQEFAFSTKDIIPVLLIIAGLVGGYLVWVQLDKRLETSGRFLTERLDAFQAQHAKLYELLQGNRDGTHAEIERVLKALAILSYNMDRAPEDRIPLGINGLPTSKPPSQ